MGEVTIMVVSLLSSMRILNVGMDFLAVSMLVYIILILHKADRKYIKSLLARRYEAVKRDMIFKNSLFILAVSVLFSFLAVLFSIIYEPNRTLINGMQLGNSFFRVLFFLYLFGVVRATNHTGQGLIGR